MRRLCYALVILLALASCRDKVICAAFQSTYILDDSVRSTYHSYLWYLNEDERKSHLASNAKIPPPDSLGITVASADEGAGVDYWAYTAQYKVPPRETRKTKYGIAKRTPLIPNIVRNLQMKTSPMENVLTPPDVSNEEAEQPADMPNDSSAYAPLDSTAAVAEVDTLNYNSPADSLGTSQSVDSAAVAQESKIEKAKKEWEQFKYGFNPLDSMQPDQEYYFRKYGWLLQNKAPEEEPEDAGRPAEAESDTTQRKGLKGLFKKKDKSDKKEKRKKKEEEVPDEIPNDEGTPPEEQAEEKPDDGF